jgi:hypothetical protein
MQIQRLWLQVAAFLILVWGSVAAVMWLTEDQVFTPEKTLALMAEAPWFEDKHLSDKQRQQHLDQVIASVIRLDFSQRNTMREDGEETINRFMDSLSDEERGDYIARVVEEHFKAVMKGIDKLPAEDRRRTIGTIHRDMKKRAAKNPELQLLIDLDPVAFEKNFTRDMALFFKEAPLKAKLEMAPWLEAFQARLQGLRIR